MTDCAMNLGPDLVVSAPGSEGVHSVHRTDSQLDLTAEYRGYSGEAGLFNLPAEPTKIEAALYGQEDVTVLKTTILVRPGDLFYVIVWPQ